MGLRVQAVCNIEAPNLQPCLSACLSAVQVLDSCMGMGVPVAGYVGGGYHSDLDVLARRHCWLHRAAAQMWRDHRM